MDQKINLKLQILPFGQINLNFTSETEEIKEQKRLPNYIMPTTTAIEKSEIVFGQKSGYRFPENTVGY